MIGRFNTQPPEGGCEDDRGDRRPPLVSTHSRPKAAAPYAALACLPDENNVSTHSRPKAAAFNPNKQIKKARVSTHSRPKAAAWKETLDGEPIVVSTHSRPKAAASAGCHLCGDDDGFNTQPPEGGCCTTKSANQASCCFNTQPPEGGCLNYHKARERDKVSTHSRPKAAAPTRQ